MNALSSDSYTLYIFLSYGFAFFIILFVLTWSALRGYRLQKKLRAAQEQLGAPKK